MVGRCRGRILHFSTAAEPAIASADMVFIAENNPTKCRGLGAGQASDLRWIEACARTVAAHATAHTVVVEKITLPVCAAETVKAIFSDAPSQSNNGPGATFALLSNPEFLAEGTVIADLELPDRVLIGGEDPAVIEALACIYGQWVPLERIVRIKL